MYDGKATTPAGTAIARQAWNVYDYMFGALRPELDVVLLACCVMKAECGFISAIISSLW
jgi:hypothetical protein